MRTRSQYPTNFCSTSRSEPLLSVSSPRRPGESFRHSATTISVLPDNALLEIFDFCRNAEINYSNNTGFHVWKWHLLVHVCRRWRQIVFGSPRRLNLRILCTSRTHVKKDICIWPTLPIVVLYSCWSRKRGVCNIISALKHPDRVCDVCLQVKGSQLEKVVTVMKKPFPLLKRLYIFTDERNVSDFPKGFLGGRSTPYLRGISFSGIPYSALPALLLSASNLVTLELRRIPPNGYISPQMMVTCLAALPRLNTFVVEFQWVTPSPERIRLPVTRIIVPALTSFRFEGASEYLEVLVAHINTPQLKEILIVYLNQSVDFQVAQLSEFIHRSAPMPLRHAFVTFSSDMVAFDVCHHEDHHHEDHYDDRRPWCLCPTRIVVKCRRIDRQVSHTAQVLSQFSATLSNVVDLKLDFWDIFVSPDYPLKGANDAEWLPLLRQFPAVQTLYVDKKLATHVTLVLDSEDITQEMVADVLPSIHSIYIEGPPTSSFEKFIAARRNSGHPVTIVDLEKEREMREREEQRRLETSS